MTAYAAMPVSESNRADAAASGLSFLLLAMAAVFACWAVGSRPLDIGTDTRVYAGFYESLGHTAIHTRLEPGFVFVSSALRWLGFSVIGYQIALFALLLLIAFIACRKYFNHVGGGRGFAMFLTASITLLFVSPMFMNGAINAVRQGLAALLEGPTPSLALHVVGATAVAFAVLLFVWKRGLLAYSSASS